MERLAKAIKLAAKIREESYNHEASNAAENLQNNMIDFNKFYEKSLLKASDEAAELLGFDETATQPIYLLLQNSWNDILDWADKIDK